MASISSHSNESERSAEPPSSDVDSAILRQRGNVASRGRSIRVVIYEIGEPDSVHRIWIDEQSTYGDIGRALEEINPTVFYVLLQPIWGPRPHWTEADPNTLLGGTCQVLYAIVKKEEVRYILGVVRTSISDYPIPIYEAAYESSRTVLEAIVASHPSLKTQIKSIIGYSDNEDVKDSQYSYDSLKRYQPSAAPAVIVTLEEPSSEFVTELSDRSIPPLLQGPFVYCKHLIEQAYDLDNFALQMIHLASALLHIIISLANATEPMLTNDGPNFDEALGADEGLADSLRIAPILACDLEELLDAFNQIMENIRSGEWSHTEIQDLIEALFGAICGDYPGAVAIRHSYGTFQELSRVDREEEARNLTRPEDDIQQVATTSVVQPVATAIVTPQRTTPGVIQHATTPSASTGDAAPKKRTLKQLFRETLRVTGLSRQRANEPESPSPTVERGKNREKDRVRPSEEASRGLQSAFTRRPKVAIPSAPTDGGDKPPMGSPQSTSMPSPVLSFSPNPTTLEGSRQGIRRSSIVGREVPVTRKSSSRQPLTSGVKAPDNPLSFTRAKPLPSSSPPLSRLRENAAPSLKRIQPPYPIPSLKGIQPPFSRLNRLPSMSTSHLPHSPTLSSRNTSTTSLNASSSYRETIRTASSLLIKHLSRPPPPLRPHEWQDVEVRLRSLTRLERLWSRSVPAPPTPSSFGSGEERERRIFCDAVQDGYVLCALLNKFEPGTIARPDPKEDGSTKTSNIIKFLAGAVRYGVPNADLFTKADLLEASSESLGRVAQTIIALVEICDPSQPSTRAKSIYISGPTVTMSSPHLPDSHPISPSSPRERYSPSHLPSVPGSSFKKPNEYLPPIGTRQTRVRPVIGKPAGSPLDILAPPPPPPVRRYSGKASASTRVSVDSTTTYSTGFSLLDNRTSSRFGTTRSSATEATSIHPSARASMDVAEQDPSGWKPSDREVARKKAAEDLRIQSSVDRARAYLGQQVVRDIISPKPDTPVTPRNDKASLPMRRPMHGHRSSVEPMPLPSMSPRVPFPRSNPGDLGTKARENVGRLSLPNQPHISSKMALPEEAAVVDSASTDSDSVRPQLSRVRYNSELGTTGTRTRNANPSESGGVRPGRSRFEDMVNLGMSADDLAVEFSISAVDIRQSLIVREEGKQPVHYQIGNGIGRGQFGAVYRALNLDTGQMVAIKRISIQDLSEDEISSLMKEVEVLKRLSHPRIVKYEGMVRSTDALSIVLEYVENGSLGQTIKAFGKLNEKLVASYVTKILEGLHYLHTSHVVHCDLKAANILTTKNGNIKLSDFGVSLNLHARALEEIKSDVAGTPNWMAPEVIELKGPSPASDIWSLGCTAIELLTGQPPYHDILNGMSVMFRIVEDLYPPIPEICSPLMEDFLKQCFKKDPKERPSAEMLFEHAWLKTAWGKYKELRPQDSIPFLRRVSVELARSDAQAPSIGTRALNASDSSLDVSENRRRKGLAPNSPRDPPSPLSPTLSEGPTREHSFIKTTFGRTVICQVCKQPVKRSAVLCQECSLIAHARCVADAPASCDIRAQLLLYTQYSQGTIAPEPPALTQGAPATSPIPILGRLLSAPDPPQSDSSLSGSSNLPGRLPSRRKWWRRSAQSPELGSPSLPPVTGPSSNL